MDHHYIEELPRPRNADGAVRCVGIEVEFGGVTESRVAELVAQHFGGEITETGNYECKVVGSRIGDVKVLLDTEYRNDADGPLARAALDLGRAVIPVEFVTQPVTPATIPDIDALCRTLAAAGASGTHDGLVLGFGLHLNVAVAGIGVDDVLPTLRAFALTEDWMRTRMPLDRSRRIMPFINPYPAALLDRLCAPDADDWSIVDLTDAYLEAVPSRNHGLDLLPILKHLDGERVDAAVPAARHKSGRPAWHYRLPDCRIDEPDWSIAQEWARWCRVERFAADRELIGALAARWRSYRGRTVPIPGRWASISAEIIESSVVT